MEYRLSRRGAGASVLQTCRRVLSIVLNHALKLGLIGRNPLVGLDAVGYRRKEPMMPDVKSVSGLLAHLREYEPEFHALCHVLAYTGMRMGEVLALRWGNVILDGAFLQVLLSRGRARGGVAEETPPKSRAGRRRIELDADTVEVLRAHQERQSERCELAGEFWQDLDLVFTSDVGWYMSTAAIRKKLARRGELLSVSGLTTRVLRHFHASVASQNGHNLVAVSQRLGHARISVTSDIYAHVLPAWQRDVAEGFAAVMRE